MNWNNDWRKTDPNTLNWSNPPPVTDKQPVVLHEIKGCLNELVK